MSVLNKNSQSYKCFSRFGSDKGCNQPIRVVISFLLVPGTQVYHRLGPRPYTVYHTMAELSCKYEAYYQESTRYQHPIGTGTGTQRYSEYLVGDK